jgi:hypothetical protein
MHDIESIQALLGSGRVARMKLFRERRGLCVDAVLGGSRSGFDNTIANVEH